MYLKLLFQIQNACLRWDKRMGERTRSQASSAHTNHGAAGLEPQEPPNLFPRPGLAGVYTDKHLSGALQRVLRTRGGGSPTCRDDGRFFFLTSNLNLHLFFPLLQSSPPPWLPSAWWRFVPFPGACFSRRCSSSLCASRSRLRTAPLSYEIPEIATYH